MTKIMAIDFETSCNGEAEFRIWRPGFKIDSVAMSWYEKDKIKHFYADTPMLIDRAIRRLAESQDRLVCHNLAFEYGVCQKLYPELNLNWAGDTMRLAQLRDNGGNWSDIIETAEDQLDRLLNEDEIGGKGRMGLSLEAVASRYLDTEFQNHKKIAHDWLTENANIKTNHGAHLHLLPPDVLKQYNLADTDTTLRLYYKLDEDLRGLSFDWSQDWVLYTLRVRLMTQAYLRGICVDREALFQVLAAVHAQILDAEKSFMDQTQQYRAAWSEMTQERAKKAQRKLPDEFNFGSNKQLKELFLGVLGICTGKLTDTGMAKVEAKLMTAEEAAKAYPSFSSKHLKLYGPLGELLLNRRKLLLVRQQVLGVLLGTEEDHLLHPEVKVAGTRTNRVAGAMNGGEQ